MSIQNKLKEFIEKYDTWIIVFLLTLISLSTLPLCFLKSNDELWNFTFIYKMTNGFIIYKDFNVVVTPLYFVIGSGLFKILGSNYLVFKIYDRVLIYVLFGLLLQKTYKKMNIDKTTSILYSILIYLFVSINLISSTYNFLSIVFILLGIFIELGNNNRKCILQGITIYLIFMTKQNVGIYYMIAIVIFYLLQKESLKAKIVKLFKTFITSFLLMIGTILFLFKTNVLYDAFNYLFAGMSEFAGFNSATEIKSIIILICIVTVLLLLFIISFLKKIKLDDKERFNIRLLCIICLFIQLINYPLINIAHVLYSSILPIILFIYVIHLFVIKKYLKEKMINISTILIIIGIMLYIPYSIYITIGYINIINQEDYYFSKDNPYFGIFAEEEMIQNINDILNYINKKNNEGKEVKIISYKAGLYNNILKVNNKNMDMPFYGNLGKNGEDGLIEEIKNLKNTKILILTKPDNLYQESQKAMNYIKENYQFEGEIGEFSIYNKP